MADRRQIIRLLDCYDMTYTRMDNRLEIDAAMALWEAYVGSPEIKDLEFASASKAEFLALVKGFNSGPYHEGLLHLESSITIFHMLWNDCPEDARERPHCQNAMACIASIFASRLEDADCRLPLVNPQPQGFEAAPMPVLVRLIRSRQAKIRGELRAIRQKYEERHGAGAAAMPSSCRHTQFIPDFANALSADMADFGELQRVMAIRKSEEGQEILSLPEWNFWAIWTLNANRLASQLMQEVTAMQDALCKGCCSDMPGYGVVQAFGRPMQRTKRGPGGDFSRFVNRSV